MNGSVRSAPCVWNELLWPARDKAHYKVVHTHTHTKSFHYQPGTLKTLIRSFGATQRRNYVTTAPEHFRSSSQQGSSPHSSLRLRFLRKSDTISSLFLWGRWPLTCRYGDVNLSEGDPRDVPRAVRRVDASQNAVIPGEEGCCRAAGGYVAFHGFSLLVRLPLRFIWFIFYIYIHIYMDEYLNLLDF